MIYPTEDLVNPNRSNIFLSSSRTGDHADELGNILDPLISDLGAKRLDFPLTIVYGALEIISLCYSYFSAHIGNEQYEPLGAECCAGNRLYTQFHAQYPEHERQRIVEGLVKGNSKIRVIFVPVAFGIGIDIPNISKFFILVCPIQWKNIFKKLDELGRMAFKQKAIFTTTVMTFQKAKNTYLRS